MGPLRRVDCRYSMTDEALAVEIVRMVQGSTNPMMRTEAYCQLIKQLRNNPNAQSVSLVVSDGRSDQRDGI